ncbi:MAG: hypothetical protein U0996_22345 [Planctomycetaceae bacterium]
MFSHSIRGWKSHVRFVTSVILILSAAQTLQAQDVPQLPAIPNPQGSSASGNTVAESPPAQQSLQAQRDEQKIRTAVADSRLIAAGESAFQQRCIQCHDAEKSLQRSKSLSGWRSTVARMARQDGADIPQSDWESIAQYLASTNPSSGTDSTQDSGAASEVTVFGTISPTLRTHGTELQNPGFFPDIWAGIAWEPQNGPVSAKAIACISCHNEHDEGYLSRIEIVQATLTLDLGQVIRGDSGKSRNGGSNCSRCGEQSCLPASQFAGQQGSDIEAFVNAGRLVVPFGAYSSQVNPGVYRTVSRPLIFNMGQRVYDENLGDPVLPMPFSDEGASLNLSVPLLDDVMAGMDVYVVNGLQGNSNISLDDSRDYVDNNRTPSVGGRWTLGTSALRLGTSVIGGQYNPQNGTGVDNRQLNYVIFGYDVSWKYQDIFRIQGEFAQRNTDAYYDFAGPQYGRDRVSGWYVESELLLSRSARLSALARWDEQSQRYAAWDPASTLPSAGFDVRRLTYGLNWTLPGGSLLMFNMEHWYLPGGFSDMDIAGVRWAASF